VFCILHSPFPPERGSVSVQILVILVPVLFGFMGFAVDLGRLYMARAELKAAANSAAIAAAQRLIGTDASIESATTAGALTMRAEFGNKYDFGGLPIGQTTGTLASEVQAPAYFETAAGAIGEGESAGGSEASGSTARHVRVTVTGEAPLIFWSFITLAQERKVNLMARAVAGASAPVCMACQIEPIAIAALDTSDTTHFGFTPNTKYTFGYTCTGVGTPTIIAGTAQRINYLLLNRYDQEATLFSDESSQAYRIGAQGLPPSTSANSCVRISAEEQVWVNAAPLPCNQNRVGSPVSAFVCGLASRFDTTPTANCEPVPEVSTIASAYTADTDLADLDDYAGYTGTIRRVITVPIVETLTAGGTMTVLGFRQFLIEPNPNDTTISTSDANARFPALYIGSVVPLRQGSFAGCTQPAAGPGRVVLHQ
jgi:Flp pilus assembly protein TadG